MRRVCEWAADRGVAVGAQVGYRDLAGFGRRRIDYEPTELRDEIIYQIAALDGFCRLQGERVRYVKPHGALYNTATVDVWQASAIVAAVVDYDRNLPVLCLPGSTLATSRTRPGCASSPRGTPTGPTSATAHWCRAASRARCSPMWTPWWRGRSGWPPRAR